MPRLLVSVGNQILLQLKAPAPPQRQACKNLPAGGSEAAVTGINIFCKCQFSSTHLNAEHNCVAHWGNPSGRILQRLESQGGRAELIDTIQAKIPISFLSEVFSPSPAILEIRLRRQFQGLNYSSIPCSVFFTLCLPKWNEHFFPLMRKAKKKPMGYLSVEWGDEVTSFTHTLYFFCCCCCSS